MTLGSGIEQQADGTSRRPMNPAPSCRRFAPAPDIATRSNSERRELSHSARAATNRYADSTSTPTWSSTNLMVENQLFWISSEIGERNNRRGVLRKIASSNLAQLTRIRTGRRCASWAIPNESEPTTRRDETVHRRPIDRISFGA